jgi:hypothetical protein
MSKRTVESERAGLLTIYPFRRFDLEFPSSRKIPCPFAGPHDDSEEGCGICRNGIYEQRVPWVNSQAAYFACIDEEENNSVLLYDFNTWFTLEVRFDEREIQLGTDLRLPHNPLVVHAVTSSQYPGQLAGSAIYNPDRLEGFMYRTLVGKGREFYGDGYLLPPDIVAYCLGLRTAVIANHPVPVSE